MPPRISKMPKAAPLPKVAKLPKPLPPPPVTVTTLADGRKQLTGKTFDFKDQIKAAAAAAGSPAIWSPATKSWTVPAATDTAFLLTRPPSPLRWQPKPREEWTREEWITYLVNRPSKRGGSGPCCKNAKSFEAYEQGPICWRCERHGETHNSFTGD